jgi:copper homeostasis protein
MPAIVRLVRAAKQRIRVMAGGGITESNVHRVIAETGVREIHASVRVHVPSPMHHRNDKISMGVIKGREYERIVVLQDKVQRLLEATMDGMHYGMKAR